MDYNLEQCFTYVDVNGYFNWDCIDSSQSQGIEQSIIPWPAPPDKPWYMDVRDSMTSFLELHPSILPILALAAAAIFVVWVMRRSSWVDYAEDAWDVEDYIEERNDAARAAEKKARKKMRKEWLKTEQKMLKSKPVSS